MKLAFKFTAFFLLGMGAVLAVHFYLRVQRELALFDEDFRSDHESMGRDLAAAVLRIWKVSGEASALSFVEEANASKSQISIRWIGTGLSENSSAPTNISARQLAVLTNDGSVLSELTGTNNKKVLQTYVPVIDNGQWLGALELSESLADAQEYIQTTIIRQIVATTIIVAVTGFIALVLGVWFVGRPVRLLVARAQRIAGGDFAGRIELRQSDELGDLAVEINTMSEQLAEATRRIAAETAARIEAIEQLRHADRLRTVGQLTSGIAHELGTPLNVVWARAKLIAGDANATPEICNGAKVVVEQSARMTKIIRQLLDFSRPARPKKSKINLIQVMRQTVSLLRPALEGRRVTVEIREPSAEVETMVDVDQMQQVASNLILNASHAMAGGGTVTVSVGERHAHPPAGVNGDAGVFAFFSVRDSGCGIAGDDRARVFEPFYTTKDVGQGTGLGLSISLGIVREHGGWIDVESVVGEGSCFTVYLPKEMQSCKDES